MTNGIEALNKAKREAYIGILEAELKAITNPTKYGEQPREYVVEALRYALDELKGLNQREVKQTYAQNTPEEHRYPLSIRGLTDACIDRSISDFGIDDWDSRDWFVALAGEVGEYANWAKKYKRGDISTEKFRTEAKKELADIQAYLPLLANSLGIDLEKVTIDKFNEVSDRIGSPIKL